MWIKNLIRKEHTKLKRRGILALRKKRVYPYMIGRNFLVHNGKKFIRVSAVHLRVGMKFGEFSFTRKVVKHKKKHKKRKK